MANEFVARRGIIAQSGGAKVTGSLLVSGSINASGYNVIADSFTGSFSGSIGTAASASYVEYNNVANKPTLVSSSTQIVAALPNGTVSSSAQYPGWVTASSQINVTQVNGYATLATTGSNTFVGNQIISGSLTTTADTMNFNGAMAVSGTLSTTGSVNNINGGFTGSFTGSLAGTFPYASLTGIPSGIVSSSSQVDITATTGYATFSSSIATKNDSQDLAIVALSNVTGSYATTASNSFTGVQTITNTTNSTNYTDGALVVQGGVGITKDVNISGSLTVAGLLTAISMSTQYVTSSQYVVGDNKIILAADDVTRFGGMSIFDSGSTSPTTASIYWDSLNHKFIYENLSGSDYGSSIIIGGPKNTGPLGSEPVLTVGRIPVTTGEDHIDSRQASSSIRIDFNTKETHVESGLYITGSVTSSVGFKGDGSQLTGIVTTLAITGSDLSTDTIDLKTSGLTFNGGNGITTTVTSDTVTISAPLGTVSSSGQIKSLLPDGTVSSSAQYPGWVTASSQIQLNAITGTTFSNNAFLFPQDVTLTGDLTVAGNDIKNNNGTAVITFAGTSNNDVRLWSGGALDVQSGEIRNNGTTAIQMSGQNVQIINSGSMNAAKINNTYYSGSTPSTIVGPVTNQVVATVKAADYDASHFDYVIKDGTNYRTGTVMAVWDGTNVEFTDTSTNDIGNTSEVSFTVDINGGSIRLKITTGNGNWTLKTSIRAL